MGWLFTVTSQCIKGSFFVLFSSEISKIYLRKMFTSMKIRTLGTVMKYHAWEMKKKRKRLENMALGHRLKTRTGKLSLWVPPVTKQIISNHFGVVLFRISCQSFFITGCNKLITSMEVKKIDMKWIKKKFVAKTLL